MLRKLLSDSGAAKALLENLQLFKEPGVLEKYLIASEVSLEVLDMFFSRIFGNERTPGANSAELFNVIRESLDVEDRNSGVYEALSARLDDGMERLEGQIADLNRQMCALQRQLHMQGEVSQLAASVEGRFDEVLQACESRMEETGQALRGHVNAQVAAVADDVLQLKQEISSKANTEEVNALSADVMRLKKAEGRCRINQMKATKPIAIISHLTGKCGGNVHEKGIVTATASGVGDSYRPKNAVEIGTDSEFRSENVRNSWLCYDFKTPRVIPTSYSIKSPNFDPGVWQPKSWILEVSNDGSEESWRVIDRRENNSELNGRHLTRNFAITSELSEPFRFIRLRLTGENHEGGHRLVICSLEVFGWLIE